MPRKPQKLEIEDIIDPDEYILMPEDVYNDLKALCKRLKIGEQEGLRRSVTGFIKSEETKERAKKDAMEHLEIPGYPGGTVTVLNGNQG